MTVAAEARAWYILALLSFVSFLNYLDRMVLAVLIEPIKHDLSLSDTQLGLVGGLAFALLYAICGLPLARIADRRNRVALLSLCLAAWSAATAVTGLALNFIQLFGARVAVGVGEAGCVPASHSLIGDLFPPKRLALAIGIFQGGGLLGLSVGMALAGIAAQAWGWRLSLFVIGSAGVPLALLVRLSVAEPARLGFDSTMRAESWTSAVGALLGRPAFRNLVIGLSIGAFATYGMGQWSPAFFMRSHGLSLRETGLYGAIVAGVGGVLGTVLGGVIMMRLRGSDVRWELWLPMGCYAACAPLFFVMYLAPGLRLALVCQFCGTVIGAVGGTVGLAALQTFAEPNRRATAIALVVMLSSLIGLGLGPLAVGMISDHLVPILGSGSLRVALAIASAFLLWAAAHFAAASRAAVTDRVDNTTAIQT